MKELDLSFYHADSQDGTWVIRHGSMCFYTLSHFDSISFLLSYILLNIFSHSKYFKVPQMNMCKVGTAENVVLTFSSYVCIGNTNRSIQTECE